jgi:hypothetical protein
MSMSTDFFGSYHTPLRHAALFSGYSPIELYLLKGRLTPSEQEWLAEEHKRLSQIENLTRQLLSNLTSSVNDVDCRNQEILDGLNFLLN